MENKIEIVEMKREHISEVVRIERATFSEPWGEKDFIDGVDASEQHYFSALMDGKVVGYAGYWGVMEEAQIYNVAVDECVRKSGVGRKLMEYLLSYGKNDGRTCFLLEVRESNEVAIHLYERLGFQVDGKRPGFYNKPVEDALLMSLHI